MGQQELVTARVDITKSYWLKDAGGMEMVLHELGTEYLTLYVNLSESSGVTNG